MTCEGCTYSTSTAVMMTANENELQAFLQSHGMLTNEVHCSKCGSECKLSKCGRYWRCQKRHAGGPRCNFKKAHRASWIARSHLSSAQIVKFVAYWTIVPPPRQKLLTSEVNIDHKTAVGWSSMCRQVCLDWSSKHFTKLGGPGVIVEVDEALFGKKRNRSGRGRCQEQWVFGAVERGGTSHRKFYLEPVEKRNAATLIAIIQRIIIPGTTIMSDGWKAYAGLSKLGYRHLVVNHNKHFVAPRTRAHTQNIERLWRDCRKHTPRYGRKRENLKGYLAEYSFKRFYPNEEERMHHFFLAAKEYSSGTP